MAKRKNVTMSDSLYRRIEESYALREDPSLTATISRLIEEGLDAEQRAFEMSEMERRIGERIDRFEKAILGGHRAAGASALAPESKAPKKQDSR